MTEPHYRRHAAWLVLAFSTWISASHAATLLQPGQPFPNFQSVDQHGEAYRFEHGTRLVLIAFEMASGKAANQFFSAQDAAFLKEHNAVFISNIYGMPRIGRMFAIPKMKRYPHRIVLANAEHLLDAFPRQQGAVTVVRLNDSGIVSAIGHWRPGQTPWPDMLAALTSSPSTVQTQP